MFYAMVGNQQGWIRICGPMISLYPMARTSTRSYKDLQACGCVVASGKEITEVA